MEIDSFILIGGRSSRLGSDKAFVEVDGVTLATRIARVIEKGLDPDHIKFIAASSEQFSGSLLAKLRHSVIFDLNPGFNAWSGLQTALVDARTKWIFVSACDHPMVSEELLKLMAVHITDMHDAVVPRQIDGRLQPLCAFYRARAVLTLIDAKVNDGGRLPQLMSIFDCLRTCVVEPDEYRDLDNSDKFFLNINTAKDLSALSDAALK